MDQDAIRAYVSETFDGVDAWVAGPGDGSPEIAWGDTFFIYDPERAFEGGWRMPFATIITKDYPDDDVSHLDRDGIFRLNIGIGKESFVSLLGDDLEVPRDMAALDTILPHPVYGRMHWVCVLNPSRETFERLKPMLAEAYEGSVNRARKAGKVS